MFMYANCLYGHTVRLEIVQSIDNGDNVKSHYSICGYRKGQLKTIMDGRNKGS